MFILQLAVIADIHHRFTEWNTRATYALARVIEKDPPDVFLLGGDAGENLYQVGEALTILSKAPCHKLFVPGNHDIWLTLEEIAAGCTSAALYREDLPRLVAQCGFHYLPRQPLVLEGIGFAGTIGWYDYSFRNPDFDGKLTLADYERKSYEGLIWMDAVRANWGMSDVQVADQMTQELRDDLAKIPSDCQDVVVMTHHVPFLPLAEMRGEIKWDYFTAFIGCHSLGRAILEDGRVRFAFAGHTHTPRTMRIGEVVASTRPLGYLRRPVRDPEAVVLRALRRFEIGDRRQGTGGRRQG